MDAAPLILVAGVVPRPDRLRSLARVHRVGWSEIRAEVTQARPDLVILGVAPAGIDVHAVLADLRRSGRAPLVHVAHEGCRCAADVCLPPSTPARAVLGVARALVASGREGSEETPAPFPRSVWQTLSRVVPGVVFTCDVATGRLTFVSPAAEALLGYAAEHLLSLSLPALAAFVHPDERHALSAAWNAALAAPDEQTIDRECRLRTQAGDWRSLRLRLLVSGAAARPREVVGVALDVTDTRRTERMLERAQRLEALGRLAGGIAHDFNNLLGVVTGHAQLTQRVLPKDHPACAGLELIVKASERAAALTQKLLLMSREPTRPLDPIEMNPLVNEIASMLQRIIAEDVELDVRLGDGVGQIRAEPTHVEQILLNLAVNARDAMPRGGRLSVETHAVRLHAGEASLLGLDGGGEFVVLTVADTGMGMDSQTRQRIFEPFFTTKPEGVGSGLGLATVRAIVERCGGAITVESILGAGTTFRIYLPQLPPASAAAVAAIAPAASGGRETVLLVEDAEPVREVTQGLLEGLGYTVLSAAHGAQALALARTHPGPIHVLLTDVVMPKLGGGGLAAQVAALRPETRVLYMSGYSDDVLEPGSGATLLQKPFTRDRLAHAIRATIERDH